MNSTNSALDTLTQRVTYAAEQVYLIQKELTWFGPSFPIPSRGPAIQHLKDLRQELLSALSEARHATTTEQPTSGETKSSSILNAILEATEENARQTVRNTQMIASIQVELGVVSTTGNSGKCGCGRWTEREHTLDDEH